MKNKIVKVYAPATIANVCAGFDVLGVALQKPGDIVIARRNQTHQFNFSVQTKFNSIPLKDNIAALVAKKMLKELQCDFGIDLVLHKLMPIGTGLGSSGASCVAAAVAVNALLKKPLNKIDLLPFILAGEKKASGAAHADNVAPSLFGGACITRNENPIDVIPFPVHRSLQWIVVRPHTVITTKEARRLLPQTLALHHVTRQLGNISGLILGLMHGDHTLIKKCSVDHIAEPVRAPFIPGYRMIKAIALKSGALACNISGSGPSIFAIAPSKMVAKKIALKMIHTLFKSTGLQADYYISSTNLKGATILAESSV